MSPDEIIGGLSQGWHAEYEVKGDTLYEVGQLISGILSTIFGLVVVIVPLILALVTTVDILYITMPIFRDVTQKREDGNEEGRLKRGLWSVFHDLGKVNIISRDAKEAVAKAETYDEPAIWLYAKSRALSYAAICIVVALIAGYSSVIQSIIRDIVYGVLQALGVA